MRQGQGGLVWRLWSARPPANDSHSPLFGDYATRAFWEGRQGSPAPMLHAHRRGNRGKSVHRISPSDWGGGRCPLRGAPGRGTRPFRSSGRDHWRCMACGATSPRCSAASVAAALGGTGARHADPQLRPRDGFATCSLPSTHAVVTAFVSRAEPLDGASVAIHFVARAPRALRPGDVFALDSPADRGARLYPNLPARPRSYRAPPAPGAARHRTISAR